MKTVRLLAVIVFMICSTISTPGQSVPAWVNKIESAVRTGEWRIVERRYYRLEGSNKFHAAQIQLVYNEEINVTVNLDLKASAKEAQAALLKEATFSSGKQMKKIKSVFPDIGDENILENPGAMGWAHIKFRKGRVYTHVMSPSEETAKKLARLLSELIPAKV